MSDTQSRRMVRGAKRVRVSLGGEIVADTIRPLLVWEIPYYPTYYFPRADVRTDLLVETGENRRSSLGLASQYQVKAGGGEGAAYVIDEAAAPELADHIAFVWSSMDHWFEEDEEVYVHPRDPYTRVDILASGRRIRVEIEGVTVADTRNGRFLFETGLPTRYYIPKVDLRMDLMTPTDTITACPYKGQARYWSVKVNGHTLVDIAWAYDYPLPESQKIAGLVAFYNEKVNVYVDEVFQERPKTKFS